jgi:hypothetical protein
MRTAFLALAGAAMASSAVAQDQPHAAIESMYFFKGTCARLVTPAGDRSAQCNTALVVVSYSNGRHSFWFSIPHQSLVAFSGLMETQSGNESALQLDLLSVTSDPKDVHAAPGTGTCTFSDPWKGIARVNCRGSTAEGQFAGDFTTDGQPPEGVGPH